MNKGANFKGNSRPMSKLSVVIIFVWIHFNFKMNKHNLTAYNIGFI